MERLGKALGLIVLVLATGVVAFLAGARLDERLGFLSRGEPYQDVGPEVVQSVRDLAELTTVEMVELTTVEKGNDFGWLNWARGDRIFMLAVARIGAGVDLGELEEGDFEVDNETGTVTLRIPHSEILYVELDNQATQVYDRDTGIFTKGDPQLESDAREVAQEILTENAVESGILRRAEDNAINTLRGFLESLGYEEVRVIVSG